MKNLLFSILKKGLTYSFLLLPIILVCVADIIGKTVFVLEFSCAFLFLIVIAMFVHIKSNLRQTAVLSLSFSLFFAVCIWLNTVSSFVLYVLCAVFLLIIIIMHLLSVYMCSISNTDFKDSCRIYKDKSVLILVPHEDDDINLCGSIIKRYTENNSRVKVAFFTNGDYYNTANQRLKETLQVMKKLGVSNEDVIFFGYSDSLISDNCHIYNCNGSDIVASKSGRKKTYALKNHKPFNDSDFTKNNMLSDIQSLISDVKADVIFCCDYDWHPDHRALSLLFEQAMHNVLIREKTYHPQIYKGFAYSTSWESVDDFYDGFNIKSSKNYPEGEIMQENNMYVWKNRVRFPVHQSDISNVIQNTLTFKLLALYSSQNAVNFASRVINSDKVFFERSTNSLLYDSAVTVSSGKNFDITGFPLCDSSDIMNKQTLPYLHCWTADSCDDERTVKIKLSNKSDIESIVIYDSPLKENHIINAMVRIGTVEFYTGELNKYGETKFTVNVCDVDEIMIKVLDFHGDCSIAKVEAFPFVKEKCTQIIKLVNSNDDFCDNYIFENGNMEVFSVYAYPNKDDFSYTITSDGGINFTKDGNRITVNCQSGCNGKIRITADDDKNVFDEICISNPSDKQRKKIRFRQILDQRVWTAVKLKSYYTGLLKRVFQF